MENSKNYLSITKHLRLIQFGAQLFLGGIFLYSGLIKAGASRQFTISLAPFTILPEDWLGPFAIILACTELLAGVLTIIPTTRKVGAALILFLCTLFISLLSWALANGIIVDCACFGESMPSITKMVFAIARDIIFAGLALFIMLVSSQRQR